MPTPIVMPRQGNTVESCVLIEWKKKKGDPVAVNDIICEVETDKAVFELESPVDGILLDVFFDEGDEIPVLTNIAVVGKKNETYDDLRPEKTETPEKLPGKSDEMIETEEPVARETLPEVPQHESSPSKSGISPRAKNLADKLAIKSEEIFGTGPGGRIIERDILEKAQHQEPLTPAAKDALSEDMAQIQSQGSGIGGRITSSDVISSREIGKSVSFAESKTREIPLKGIRKLIAQRMLDSIQNSAQLTLNRTADATAILSLRKRYKNSKKYTQFNNVTINDMILFAVTKVIADHPDLNSLFLKDKIVYYENIHLGFAVDTPRGLMVPVIRNAQNFNLLSMSGETKRLSSACLEKKIQPEELNDGTFTVTNLGSFGIETFSPILNLPQTAILGVGNINPKPVTLDNGIKFVPHLAFSLTIDHQVIDGATGARFLQDLADAIAEIEIITRI
jgi:pyruvate dehydrogenase E2 component (dihydrolipoamide acetyltransferase)